MTLDLLKPIWVELFVFAGALLVLFVDLFLSDKARKHLSMLAALLLTTAFFLSTTLDGRGPIGLVYVGNAFSVLVKQLLLGCAFLCVLGGREFVNRATPKKQGEFYFLLLLSLGGMMLLSGVRDLILLVVCFELMGVPLYILATWFSEEATPEKRQLEVQRGAESGLKFFLVGGSSTAVTLFGLSLLTGTAGGTHFDALLSAPQSPLSVMGMLLVLGGMGFKIGAVPFHMWVPDTYQGAMTPVVAFLSVAPKAAGLVTLTVLAQKAIPGSLWKQAFVGLSVLTMVVGNVMALPQRNVKRLLGYSGVAQIGYMLLGLCVGDAYSLGMLLFYLCGYAATNIGVFLVVHAVSDTEGDDSLEGFAGLAKRSPWLGMALLVFLLSLAGIPFVVGFWAKLYIFMAAFQAGFGGLVVVGAVLAVVGLFYYLQVARSAYMAPPKQAERVFVTPWLALTIVCCLLLVVGMGAYPGPWIETCQKAAESLLSGP